MNSFSNAMMQRHLGQAEIVSPRPVGLYELVRNTGMENLDQIKQNLADTGQDVMPYSLQEAERSIHPPDVQTPNPLSTNKWPRQEQENPLTDSRPTDRKTLQIISPLLTSEFQPPVQSVNKQRTSNDLNSHDIKKSYLFQPDPVPTRHEFNSPDTQEQKTEQITQQYLTQTQIERRIETHVEPIIKSDKAVDIVQPATSPINSGTQTQFKQSGQFTVLPPPKMNQTPAAPIIKVSIGRIEVKAVVQTLSQPAKNSPIPKPRMSLDDYLKKQDNQPK